jgi:hypothetical protein
MHDGEQGEVRRRDAAVFAVGPIRRRHAVPRDMLVALVVGVIAFLAGVAVSSGSGAVQPEPSAIPGTPPAVAVAPAEIMSPAASSPAPTPASTAPPGSSAFVRAFAPAVLVTGLPNGRGCVVGQPGTKEVPRTRRDGPRLTFQRSWLIWCPIPPARRQAFLLALFGGLVDRVPADTFGFSTSKGAGGDALFPYGEPPFAGTVAVTADAAGTGLSVAIVLQEWQAR